MCTGLHVKYPLFLADFMKFEFPGKSFFSEKNAESQNFMKIPSNLNRVVPCGLTEGRT